jgi:hypothetical protein
MNVAALVTIKEILDRTRTEDPQDYEAWGRAAGSEVATYPELALEVLVDEMRDRARAIVGREEKRTRDGVATVIADIRSGQMVVWRESSDAIWLRETGKRLIREGESKLRLGQLMQQAADCVEAHPGLSAREAWVAEGLDTGELDAATEAAEAI